MTTATMNFSVPWEALGRDPADFLRPEIGPTWPLEAHEVVLRDLKPELENPEKASTPMEQLDSRGFAVVKRKGVTIGPLGQQKDWNKAFLQVFSMSFIIYEFIVYIVVHVLIYIYS